MIDNNKVNIDKKMIISKKVITETDTQEMAKDIFPHINSRHIVLLIGDIGAGKTFLAREFLRLWGVEEPVTSPTFNLIHEFTVNNLHIIHADFYRLNYERELIDLDILENFTLHTGPIFIEWGERFPSLRREVDLEIIIQMTPDGKRKIQVFKNISKS